MKRKELEDLGLNEEQIEATIKLNGLAVEKYKSQATEFEEKYNQASAEVENRAKEIEALKSNVQLSEEDKAKFDKLTNDFNEYKEQAEAREHKIKYDNALEVAILGTNTIDKVGFKAHLDLEKIKLEDGKLVGFDEQYELIKENQSHYFLEENKVSKNKRVETTLPKNASIDDEIRAGFKNLRK